MRGRCGGAGGELAAAADLHGARARDASQRLLGSVVLAVGAGLVGLGVGLIMVDLWPDRAITGGVLFGDLLFLVLPGLVAMWTGRRLRRRSTR